jgi:hypothetical protein
MARNYKQGKFAPTRPEKYIGDPTQVVYRSGWERKMMRKLDESSTILGWSSETVIIPYISPVDGRAHRYFVDFLVVAKSPNGDKIVTLIEVKPYAQTIQPVKTARKTKERFMSEIATYAVNQAKWAAAEAYCVKRGWKFTVLTENDINFV